MCVCVCVCVCVLKWLTEILVQVYICIYLYYNSTILIFGDQQNPTNMVFKLIRAVGYKQARRWGGALGAYTPALFPQKVHLPSYTRTSLTGRRPVVCNRLFCMEKAEYKLY